MVGYLSIVNVVLFNFYARQDKENKADFRYKDKDGLPEEAHGQEQTVQWIPLSEPCFPKLGEH